jgi:hypothetical protein
VSRSADGSCSLSRTDSFLCPRRFALFREGRYGFNTR